MLAKRHHYTFIRVRDIRVNNTYYETLIRNGGGFLFPARPDQVPARILFGKNMYYVTSSILHCGFSILFGKNEFTSPPDRDVVWQNCVHYLFLFTGSERSRFREHLPNNIDLETTGERSFNKTLTEIS